MFSASRHIFFCSTMTLFTRNGIKLYPPFVISGGDWIKVGGWFVLLGVCSLWRSDIYKIPLSGPMGLLIVRGSARLSPNGVEIIIILCRRGLIASFFQRLFRIYFVSADEHSWKGTRLSNQGAPRDEWERIRSPSLANLVRWLNLGGGGVLCDIYEITLLPSIIPP